MSSDRAMPVLLMIAERFAPDVGGVARSAYRTADAIARLGWHVHVLSWTKSLPAGVLETAPVQRPNGTPGGVIVHRLGLFSNMDSSMQHTINVLEWLHEKHGFSATWGHYVYPAGYMAVVFAESAGLASTVSARGNDIDRLMFPPGDFARLLWTLERATAVSCVSSDLAKKVQMLLGKGVNLVVVPNVVDTRTFCPLDAPNNQRLRTSLGIQADEAVLGFCGELRHKKGLPFLLAALAEVRQTRPACLLVIGEVRPREQAHLATFASEHPEAEKRILVTGHLDDQSDVAEHLRLCDVILQPSVWDGLPNAILESMACGRLVLASDAGGIPEAIEDGIDGFMIPKAMLNNLGQAILDLLGLPDDRRKEIESAARQRIVRCFHDEVEAARLGEVLSHLSSAPSEMPAKSS